MGEKRAYKARKPGGGRKKLKPEYDAGKNLKDQMDTAVALYEEDCSLQSIADVLNAHLHKEEPPPTDALLSARFSVFLPLCISAAVLLQH